MARGRWIQHPETGELIPAGEYARPEPQRSSLPMPMVISDHLDGIVNPMDGKRYDSKSRYYAEVKARGGEIMGNDAPLPVNRETLHEGGVAQDAKRAYEALAD